MLDGPGLQMILCSSDDDATALRESGFQSVRVVNDSNSLFVQNADGWDMDPALAIMSKFVLAFESGSERLRDAIGARLDDTACRWVEWPDGCRSAADTLRRRGPTELGAIVRAGRPMWTDEVCVMSDIPEPDEQQSYTTGFKLLDEHGFRLVRPAFMPVIGPYGSGKSVLLRQLICNLYHLHGWRTLITAFEEKIKPRYVRDFRRHMIRQEVINPRSGEVDWRPIHQSQWTAQHVETADKQIEDAFRFLRRKRNATLDMERLIDRIEYAVRVYGLECVVIDPVNEIDHQVGRGESKTDYMGRFIMRLKALADDYDLLMIVAAHPPKEGVEKRLSKGRPMTLNDGADTAHWGNKADIGWCVWRPGMDDMCPTYLHIDKLKDHDIMGSPTVAKLMLDKGLGRFAATQIGYDVLGEMADV